MLMSAVTSRQWPRGTQARVLSVVEDEAVPAEELREAGHTVEVVQQEMNRRGEQISALTVEPLRRLGIEAEVTIMRGDPSWLINFEARSWQADMILIRAHNRTDFRNWMLGSVAKSVVRDAHCSVEVVRAVKDGPAAGNGHFKILLATDGSEHSVAATRAVAERPWPEGTEVKILSMIGPVTYSMEEVGLLEGGRTERAHRAMEDAAQILNGAGLRTSGEVFAGRVERRITREAGEWGADLIVVGAREPGGLRRFLTGSVSEAVASRAHCPVNIIRANKREGAALR